MAAPNPAAPAAPAAAPAPPAPATEAPPAAPFGKLTLGAYVEALYAWNFNRPSNGLTNYRGFDNRHDTFTLSNAVLDAQWEVGPVTGRVALQVGHTPDTYYAAEPTSPGSAGAGTADSSSWKYLQQAYVGYKAPLGKGLLLQAGLFLSPIGVEAMAVKDNWNWSRSNLFFGLPAYHAGARATQQLTERVSATLAAYNGWNSVDDNSPGKSLSVQLQYSDPDRLNASLLYFGGVERPTGAPEGSPWRHLFDAWAQLRPVEPLWLAVHGDTGFEVNTFGTSWWAAGALYAQGRVVRWLYLAARGDYFREQVASNALGSAAAIFFPATRVGSVTGTIDVRPVDNLSLRLEARGDLASSAMYFRGAVSGDGSTASPFVPNATSQTTLTCGITAWFQ